MAYTVTNLLSGQVLTTQGEAIGVSVTALQATSTRAAITAFCTGVQGGNPAGLRARYAIVPNNPGAASAALARSLMRISKVLNLHLDPNAGDGNSYAQSVEPFLPGLYIVAWLEVPSGSSGDPYRPVATPLSGTVTVICAESP